MPYVRHTAFAVNLVIALGLLRALVNQLSAWLVFLLSVPVIVALIPLFRPESKLVCGILLMVICIIGSVSIFWLFVPGALVLLLPEQKPTGHD